MFDFICTIWWYIQAAVWSGVALSLLTYLGTQPQTFCSLIPLTAGPLDLQVPL
jgi:hypothetical protein